MKTEGHVHCPVNGWDCPYYSCSPIPCQCTIENPMEQCDDFYTMWGDTDEDYICYEKH